MVGGALSILGHQNLCHCCCCCWGTDGKQCWLAEQLGKIYLCLSGLVIHSIYLDLYDYWSCGPLTECLSKGSRVGKWWLRHGSILRPQVVCMDAGSWSIGLDLSGRCCCCYVLLFFGCRLLGADAIHRSGTRILIACLTLHKYAHDRIPRHTY